MPTDNENVRGLKLASGIGNAGRAPRAATVPPGTTNNESAVGSNRRPRSDLDVRKARHRREVGGQSDPTPAGRDRRGPHRQPASADVASAVELPGGLGLQLP